MKNPPISPDIVRLQDIFEAIDALAGYRLEDFAHRRALHSAAFEFTIIGEASRQISALFKQEHSGLPWREMTDMRNKIVHEYEGLNAELMIQVIHDELPSLRQQIAGVLASYLKHLPKL